MQCTSAGNPTAEPDADLGADMDDNVGPGASDGPESNMPRLQDIINDFAVGYAASHRRRNGQSASDSEDQDSGDDGANTGNEVGLDDWQSDEEEVSDGSDTDDNTLSALDRLSQTFACEVSNIGTLILSLTEQQSHSHMLYATAERLTTADVEILSAFALRIISHMNLSTFEMLPHAFHRQGVLTWKQVSSRAAFLSGIKPVVYQCCVNSCCCFIGPHEKSQQCPYCDAPRYDLCGNPQKSFTYIPLIPRLTAFFQNESLAKKMQYRAGNGVQDHQHEHGKIKDIFDGSHYLHLLGTPVSIQGKEYSYNYFSDPRDIALGLSTDGFAPFRHRKSTAWPLLIFNFNLPPEIRFHHEHVLCLGIIPGPKKPKDFDLFLFPMVEELLALAVGVPAFNATTQELFCLRSYLILAFGDIPAISMVMHMKGHNGLRPCRMCNIPALRIPSSRATTHYVPLDRSRHPDIVHSPSAIKVFDGTDLPMHTHEEILEQAHQVDACNTDVEALRLSKDYGVKGVPLVSHVPGLRLPQSFPYDFMHLIWENVIKNLVLLWTGEYKGIDQGKECYELDPKVWEAVGAATFGSGLTIPHAFGSRSPNIASERSAFTAETWSFWMLFLGPALLHRRFKKDRYFQHFIDLVKLLNICLQFEYSNDNVKAVHAGFVAWVEKYEKYVYQLHMVLVLILNALIPL
jgi:hypothetical protein